jgi:hypothetical protein
MDHKKTIEKKSLSMKIKKYMSGVHINNVIPNLLVVLKIVIYSFNKSLKKILLTNRR